MTTLLIDNGIELDVANEKGHTPLHVAARNGHINIVRLLCLSGCDVDKTNHGIRADVTAIKYGHLDIANLLDKLRNVSIIIDIDTLLLSLYLIFIVFYFFFFHPYEGYSTRKLY